MSSLFCCDSIQPYRPRVLDREAKFSDFMAWASFPQAGSQDDIKKEVESGELKASFAVQLVRQVNFGPLESKRYFEPIEGKDQEFNEIIENDLIQANFQKVNS